MTTKMDRDRLLDAVQGFYGSPERWPCTREHAASYLDRALRRFPDPSAIVAKYNREALRLEFKEYPPEDFEDPRAPEIIFIDILDEWDKLASEEDYAASGGFYLWDTDVTVDG